MSYHQIKSIGLTVIQSCDWRIGPILVIVGMGLVYGAAIG